jgi:puromycin-sensitive aminopeptidase
VPTEADFRLPRSVVPDHYELRFEPDLETATFAGSGFVDVVVLEATDAVVLNSAEIEIERAVLIDSGGRTQEATVTYDKDREQAELRLAEAAALGPARMELRFGGILNDQLRGFYRSTYTNERGESKAIATTQFESTDARRAFPCWDEPDFKATFGITLVVPDGLMAISNAPEQSREPATPGKVAVRFAPTVKMSTYLVAFVVGDLDTTEVVDVDGIPLRVIYPPGKGHLTDFALEAGAFSLRYYADYYGIPYPGAKLDMIAIPDFAAGAMENLGAVTYRETALLIDRERATQAELQRVAEVVAHEIAHMWFGDLVTMKWWNGIWLNEAFATFASYKCVEAFRPDWQIWLRFAVDRDGAFDIDATEHTRPIEFPVASPQDADEMFDSLTYEKGSSVLRMVEQFIGEEVFQAGVSAYLEAHAFGNTETHDLWRALDEASGQPISSIMDTWIFQGGYPEIGVDGDAGEYRLFQRQFRYLAPGDNSWKVPVLARSDGRRVSVLLTEPSQDLVAGADLVVNAGGDGFYRVRYAPHLAVRIREGVGGLSAAERRSIVADTWASTEAGDLPAADFLDLVGFLRTEDDVDVWGAMLRGLDALERVVATEHRPALEQFIADIVRDRGDDLGWAPVAGEDDRTRRLRGALIRALGNLARVDIVIERARSEHERSVADPGSVDAEVRDAALWVTAANGDEADFDRFLELSDEAIDPQDVVRYLRAAAAVPGAGPTERMFRRVLDGGVRSQDSFWVLAQMLGHRVNGPATWELMKGDWEGMLSVMPPGGARSYIVGRLPNRSEPALAADIEAWLATHPIESGERYIAQQIDLMKVQVGLREREAEGLGDALA